MKRSIITNFFLSMMMVVTCVGFYSCGDDDEDDNGSSTNVTPARMSELEKWLTKPMGIVDINIKTSSYESIRKEVAKSYKIKESESNGRPYFTVNVEDNPSLGSLSYQGLSFTHIQISSLPNGICLINGFDVEKSKATNGYQTYIDKIVADFKSNLNVIMALDQESDVRIQYTGTSTVNNYRYDIDVHNYSFMDNYQFSIWAWY